MTTPTKEQIDIIRTKQCQKVRKHHSCKECIWSYNGPVCKENKKLYFAGVKFIITEWEKIRGRTNADN